MSSPFSIFFRNFRLSTGLTQLDFAQEIGYEQGLVSAFETGTKTPSEEFIAALKNTFEIDSQEIEEMELALRTSALIFKLPRDASPEAYRFCNDFFDRVETMHPALLDTLQTMLEFQDKVATSSTKQLRRLKRRASIRSDDQLHSQENPCKPLLASAVIDAA